MKKEIIVTAIIFFNIAISFGQKYHPWQKENRYKPLSSQDIFPFKMPQGKNINNSKFTSKLSINNNLVASRYELISYNNSLTISDSNIVIPKSWGELYSIPAELYIKGFINVIRVRDSNYNNYEINNFQVLKPLDFESYSICYDFEDLCPLILSCQGITQQTSDFYILSDTKFTNAIIEKKDTTIINDDVKNEYEFLTLDLNNDGFIDGFMYKNICIDENSIDGNLTNNEEKIIVATYIDNNWMMTSSFIKNDEYTIGY